MDELVAWVRAQFDEDERVARAAGSQVWSDDALADDPIPMVGTVGYLRQNCHLDPEYWQHIALHDPARVLREIEAKRQILDLWESEPSIRWADGGLIPMHFALPYSGRDGYREQWRPADTVG